MISLSIRSPGFASLYEVGPIPCGVFSVRSTSNMNASVVEEGPRIAPSPRGGTLFVSLYAWTCIIVTVAIARLVIILHQKVAFGYDDSAAFAGTVSRVAA